MHEAILTRGMVQGLKFGDRIQIFVPENCVLLHEGACHLEAQHKEAGLQKCVAQLLRYNGRDAVLGWLEYMNSIANDLFLNKFYLLD